MSDRIIVAGAIAAFLFGISVISGRVTLAMMRRGRTGHETGFRLWAEILAFPAQVALIVWLFVYLNWYWAVGAIVLGLFLFGAAVNRNNLEAFYEAQPFLNGFVVFCTIMVWVAIHF